MGYPYDPLPMFGRSEFSYASLIFVLAASRLNAATALTPAVPVDEQALSLCPGATASQATYLDDDDDDDKNVQPQRPSIAATTVSPATSSPQPNRYFFGLLDSRSSYGKDFFHDPLIGPTGL